MELGAYVAARRKELSLVQKQVADALGYTVQAVSRFESGESQISLSALPKLADLLQLRFDDLLRCTPNAPTCLDKNDPIDPEAFSKNLVGLRKQKGLSQRQLSDELNVGLRSLQNYEKGSLPSPEIALRMANFFELEPSGLCCHPIVHGHVSFWKTKWRFVVMPVLLIAVSAGSSVTTAAALGAFRQSTETSSLSTSDFYSLPTSGDNPPDSIPASSNNNPPPSSDNPTSSSDTGSSSTDTTSNPPKPTSSDDTTSSSSSEESSSSSSSSSNEQSIPTPSSSSSDNGGTASSSSSSPATPASSSSSSTDTTYPGFAGLKSLSLVSADGTSLAPGNHTFQLVSDPADYFSTIGATNEYSTNVDHTGMAYVQDDASNPYSPITLTIGSDVTNGFQQTYTFKSTLNHRYVTAAATVTIVNSNGDLDSDLFPGLKNVVTKIGFSTAGPWIQGPYQGAPCTFYATYLTEPADWESTHSAVNGLKTRSFYFSGNPVTGTYPIQMGTMENIGTNPCTVMIPDNAPTGDIYQVWVCIQIRDSNVVYGIVNGPHFEYIINYD